MSRAIPSSLDEYLFVTSNPDNLIINGEIMPLRNSQDPNSISYKKCLRGEDPIFLNEAMYIRSLSGSGGAGVGNPTPDKYIRASKLSHVRSSITSCWGGSSGNNYYWSVTKPNIPAAVLSENQQWGDYIRPYYNTLPSQRSAGDNYTVLDSEQVMNLYRDIKQLNYSYRLSGRGSAVPYNDSQSYTYRWHEIENRPYYQPPSPDYDYTSTSYLWYDQENTSWDKDEGYPGDIENSTTWKTIANSLTFTERTSTPPNLAKTCVEIQPWAEMEVVNYGQTMDYSSSGDTDSFSEYKYVVIPLKSDYTDMLNETVPTVNSSELDAAIDLAYTTAGLERYCADIQLTPATGTHTYRSATSHCRVWTLFYLIHLKYCSLENITIQ